MREGWEYRKLLEVCDFQGGSQPPKSEWIDHEEKGYVRMLQIRDYTQSRNVSPEYVKLTKRTKYCSKDDIMIGRYGASLGKILTGLEGAYNVAIMRTIPNENVLKKQYLRFYLLSNVFQNFLLHIGGRAAQAGFSKEDLKELQIQLPPLSEQQRIVAYLDTSFAKIDEMKANAAKALSEAKVLFQTELKKCMEKKDGWEEKKIEEIAEIKGGRRVPKGYKLQLTPTDHKYIRVSDFNDKGTVNTDSIQYISDEVYETIKQYTISNKDVYISIAGTIGKTGIIPKELNGANLTENACKLILRNSVDKHFVYYYTQSDVFKQQISLQTRISAQPKLAITRLAKIIINIPPLSTQHLIVTHLDTLSQKVQELEQSYNTILAECDALKQAILRETFE